ncbi:hypothetical protein LXA43DRAFT_953550 [Ganoderma leucocontextum]|nr:hypothetical protein LXA43DRAFT_953550 [Ganoderma leucocontextum]
MPLSLEGVEAHPGLYIGPALVSLTLESIETGILINQSLTFWERAERELAVVRAVVSFVTSIAFLQTCFSFYTSWRTFVENFGNWYSSVDFVWADKIQSILASAFRSRHTIEYSYVHVQTVSMAAPVQAFLIWRCWSLVNRNRYVLVPLLLLLLTSIIAGITVTVETFQTHFGIVRVNEGPLPKIPINITCTLSSRTSCRSHWRTNSGDVPVVLSLSSGALLDVLVTGILLTFLARSKQHVTSSRFRRILRRLTVLIWEAALPPCVCAILTVVTYLTVVNENYWDLTFQAILGKLYVISLFVTLNGRAELQGGPVIGFSTNRLSDMAWGMSTPIRVGVCTPLLLGSSVSDLVCFRSRRTRKAEGRRIPREMDEVLSIPPASQLALLSLRSGRSHVDTP